MRVTVLLLCGVLVLPAWAPTTRPVPLPDRGGSIAGRVLRPDGLPQPDAEVVAATRGPDGRLRLSAWRARTAFDGQYAIMGVPAGRYLVLVRVVGADTAMDGRPEATLFPGVPVTEPGTAVEVFAGVPMAGVDIWLQPAPRRFQVSGRVVDPRGRPLEQIAIEFGHARSRADHVWTLTDPGGLFTLDRVPPGTIVLRARAESPDGPLVGLASVALAIESAQDLRVELREPGRVYHLLRPSALYPADEAVLDASGAFDVAASVGEHEIVVAGLPSGWRVRGTPSVWLAPGETLSDLRVEVGPGS